MLNQFLDDQANRIYRTSVLRSVIVTLAFTLGVSITPQTARADIEGYTEINGYLFEDQWLEDNVNEADYSPLLHANTLYIQLSEVTRKIDAFKLKDSYCLPPDRPLKSWDRDDLNDFVEDLKAFDRWYAQLGPLAAMAPLSDEAETYGVHAQLVSEVIAVKISGSLVKVYDMLLQLSSKPEVDCSPPPPPSHSSASLDPAPDLLGALNNAQGQNPYRSRPQINLPLGEDPAELVREAEYQSDQRQRDVRRHERRLDRESGERRARDSRETHEAPGPRRTVNGSGDGRSSATDVPGEAGETQTQAVETHERVETPAETPNAESLPVETHPNILSHPVDVSPKVLRIPSEPTIPREIMAEPVVTHPAPDPEVTVDTSVTTERSQVERPNNARFRSGNFETRTGVSGETALELESRTEF